MSSSILLGMADNTRLDEIKKTLTPDQLRYLYERVLCRTDAEAARNCGLAPITVYKWNENTPIQEAVNLLMDEGLQVSLDIMRRNLARAAKVKVGGLDSKKEAIRQGAATEILDRFHGRPKQSIDATVTADVTVKGYMVVSPDDWDEPDSSLPATGLADSPLA